MQDYTVEFPLFVGKISPNVGKIPPIRDIIIIYFNLVICCFQFKHLNNVWNIFIMSFNLRNGKNYKFPFFGEKYPIVVKENPPICVNIIRFPLNHMLFFNLNT